MIIFGATGDLAQHKLIPALFSLFKEGQLAEDFFIIGFSRRDFKEDEFRNYFQNQKDDPKWEDFAKHLFYQSGSFEEEKGYLDLAGKLKEIDTQMGACITRFFYLATPPDHYQMILDKLVETKLSIGCGYPSNTLGTTSAEGRPSQDFGSSKWTRVVIEKPFGKDLETARDLDRKLSEIFEEKQIFRVDHYLGKETVQNMLAFRFANGIFEPVWNKNFIDHVQITVAEQVGVEHRGAYYEHEWELKNGSKEK